MTHTDKLAELLTTPRGLSLFRSLQSLGIFCNGNKDTTAPQVNQRPRAILDWKAEGDGDTVTFRRRQLLRCKPAVIQAKHPSTMRVCLFGESMAAGFPLAPSYTPAIVLEGLLQELGFGWAKAAEVIDLAEPNMGPSEQLRVCEAAMQLEPDVCVFMGGNNWYYGLSVEPTASPEARVTYAQSMASTGPRKLAGVFRQQLTQRANTMLETLTGYASAAGAQSIVVVPPVNHHWERRTPVPWLGDRATRQWHELLLNAQRLLEQHEYEAAIDAANQMTELEGHVTGCPEHIRGRAYLGLGRKKDARDEALAAVDAANWQNYTWALPQLPAYVANAMRVNAKNYGYQCVDLERVFNEHTGEPYHDFSLFYDQCHLTEQGIQVAMAAVCSAILETQSKANPKVWSDIVPNAAKPMETIAAGACFQAAHWMSQFYPGTAVDDLKQQICQLLEAAVAYDEQYLAVMEDHISVRNLSCTPGLNAAVPAAARLPGIATSLLANRLNAAFTECLIEVLRNHESRTLEGTLESIVASYQARLVDGIDLVEPRFRDWFWERTPVAWHDPAERHGSPFYRAFWSESSFSFFCDGRRRLLFCLSARATCIDSTVSVEVNNSPVASFVLSQNWQRFQGEIPCDLLISGVNKIGLHWSMPVFDDNAAIAQAVADFGVGVDTDLFPVFGEVFSFRLQTATDE